MPPSPFLSELLFELLMVLLMVLMLTFPFLIEESVFFFGLSFFSSVSLCFLANLTPHRTIFCALVQYSSTSMVSTFQQMIHGPLSSRALMDVTTACTLSAAGRYIVGRSVDSDVSLLSNSVPLRFLLVTRRASHEIIQWLLVPAALLEAVLSSSSFRSVHTRMPKTNDKTR